MEIWPYGLRRANTDLGALSGLEVVGTFHVIRCLPSTSSCIVSIGRTSWYQRNWFSHNSKVVEDGFWTVGFTSEQLAEWRDRRRIRGDKDGQRSGVPAGN